MNPQDLKLQAGDAPFNHDPSQSFTLPARFYLDEDIFQREEQSIFFKNWWYSGHSSQLQRSGDYITTMSFARFTTSANIGGTNLYRVLVIQVSLCALIMRGPMILMAH